MFCNGAVAVRMNSYLIARLNILCMNDTIRNTHIYTWMPVRAMKCVMMLPQFGTSQLDVMTNHHKATALNSALLSYRKPSTSDTTDTNDHVYYNTTSIAETGRNIPTCGIGGRTQYRPNTTKLAPHSSTI